MEQSNVRVNLVNGDVQKFFIRDTKALVELLETDDCK